MVLHFIAVNYNFSTRTISAFESSVEAMVLISSLVFATSKKLSFQRPLASNRLCPVAL